MEQMFAGTSFLSDLLAELFGLLFYCPVLSWVSRSQKLYVRYLSFLLPLLGIFGAAVWRSQDDDNNIDISTREESKVKLQRHGEEVVLRLSGRDVEMVLERMGLGGSSCGDGLGADDLNCLFEEEPSLEEVKEAFRVFDHNGDGFIDAKELQRVLSILGFKEGSSADDCRRMISAYDENKDGRIDFNEFVKFMECSFC